MGGISYRVPDRDAVPGGPNRQHDTTNVTEIGVAAIKHRLKNKPASAHTHASFMGYVHARLLELQCVENDF